MTLATATINPLESFRARKGLTIKEASAAYNEIAPEPCKIYDQTWGYWERFLNGANNGSTPQVRNIPILALLLDCDAAELWGLFKEARLRRN